MQKYLLYSVLIVTLAFMGCPKKDGQEAGNAAQKSAVKTMTTLLPAETEVFIKFSSIETLYTHSSVTETSVLGSSVDVGSFQETLGFNPLDQEAVKAAGFDIQKPLVLALTDLVVEEGQERPHVTFLLMLPVTNAKKAVATVTSAITQEDSEFTMAKDGKLTVFSDADNQTLLYLAVKDDYLIFGGNPAQDARAVFAAILSGDSALAEASNYNEITSAMNAYEEVFTYINIAAIARQNADNLTQFFETRSGLSGAPAVGAGMAYLEDFEAAGLTLDLERPDFVLNTCVTLKDEARSKALWTDIHINKSAAMRIVENPLLFLSWAVNVKAYYQLLTDMHQDMDTNPLSGPLAAFESIAGIDVEKELIDNLGGNVNLGVYDGSTITMTNYNTLMSFTVNDETAMQQTLDKGIKALPAQQQAMITTQTVDGVKTYVALAGLSQVFVGIHDKQVILTTNKPMFQKALAGDVSNGFTAGMQPEELAETVQNTGNIFYLNIDEVVKALRNFELFLQGVGGKPGMMQNIYATAQKFEYVMASSRLDDDAIVTQVQIKTRFTEPFLIELVNIIENYEQP